MRLVNVVSIIAAIMMIIAGIIGLVTWIITPNVLGIIYFGAGTLCAIGILAYTIDEIKNEKN